jgi:pimeloyl-ACP methyl ester carboxylesterase
VPASTADAAINAVADAGDNLVVVGHSLAGLTIPLIASRRPVSRLVYLRAVLPRRGRAHDDVAAEEPDMSGPPSPGAATYTDDRGTSRWYPDAAAGLFFSDCPPELATWATDRAGQPSPIEGFEIHVVPNRELGP